ncbi:hypothetical protein M0805_001678 [Coniferiporia weirii]|nr:hypothetical protein M0805_001678 [Coniferiporia weirii]
MGVQGLAPFLQKICPEVIKTLPDRLRGFRGKTIVFDGTLITQRLHWAQTPHHYRHVLGWYRLITELKDNGVNAICVFDGKSRSSAKAQENERRVNARRIISARSTLEAERLSRLKKMSNILKTCEALLPPERPKAKSKLRKAPSRSKSKCKQPPPPPEPAVIQDEQRLAEQLCHEDQSTSLGSGQDSCDENQPVSLKPKQGSHDEGPPTTPESRQDVHIGEQLVGLESNQVSNDNLKEQPVSLEQGSHIGDQLITPELDGDLENQLIRLELKQDDHDEGQAIGSELEQETRDVAQSISSESEQGSYNEHQPVSPESRLDSCDESERIISEHDYQDEDQCMRAETGRDKDVVLTPTEPPTTGRPGELEGPRAPEGPCELEEQANDPLQVSSYDDLGEGFMRGLTALIPEALSNELANLHEEYQSSIRSTCIDPDIQAEFPNGGHFASDLPELASVSDLLDSAEASPVEASESKLQLILTREEGQLWSEVEAIVAQQDSVSSSSILTDLINRSQALSESYEKRSKPPTRETYEESKTLLDAMGIPCVECDGPYEAEALASSLVHHGIADCVASEDTDVLVYDAPLLRNITARHGALVSVSGTAVRDALGLERASFVDFALLLGTDFSPRLRNVGPKRALRFITTHGSIERVLEHEPRYAPNDAETYLAQVERARQVFSALPPIPLEEELKIRESDQKRITKLLSRFGLARAAVDEDWDPRAPLAGNYFEDSPLEKENIIIDSTFG